MHDFGELSNIPALSLPLLWPDLALHLTMQTLALSLTMLWPDPYSQDEEGALVAS